MTDFYSAFVQTPTGPGVSLDDLDAPQDVTDIDRGEQHSGQVRMAYRLAVAERGRLMHVHGIGWHWWDGTRWAADNQGRAKQAVLEVLRAALAASLEDKALRTDVKRCESAAGVNGVLELAAALEAFAVTVEDLDADPYLLNTATGTLDLRTLEVKAHDPADRITKVTRAGYRGTVEASPWSAFLTRVLPDEELRSFLQRLTGVALEGRVTEHVLPILTGTGANGKGTFYSAVLHALGDYASTAEPELFLHRDGAHPTGEMDLLGKRWVVVSESDKNRKLAEATMKRLTGGDKIKARRMRQDFVEFTPAHTVSLVTNHLPLVSGDDPAIWRRLRVIPFDVVIPEDERDGHLDERLQLDADAVLAWAVAGHAAYVETGLAEPAAVLAATERYQLDSDALSRFLAERCMTGEHYSVPAGELFTEFELWCHEEGVESGSKKAFGQALDRKGFKTSKVRAGILRRGIGLYAQGDIHDVA